MTRADETRSNLSGRRATTLGWPPGTPRPVGTYAAVRLLSLQNDPEPEERYDLTRYDAGIADASCDLIVRGAGRVDLEGDSVHKRDAERADREPAEQLAQRLHALAPRPRRERCGARAPAAIGASPGRLWPPTSTTLHIGCTPP